MADGIQLFDAEGRRVGRSQATAQWAIAMVTMSRIGMAIPSMGRRPGPGAAGSCGAERS